jgi:hypothetical protein
MKARATLTYVPALPGTTAERCPCTSHLKNGTLAPILSPKLCIGWPLTYQSFGLFESATISNDNDSGADWARLAGTNSGSGGQELARSCLCSSGGMVLRTEDITLQAAQDERKMLLARPLGL